MRRVLIAGALMLLCARPVAAQQSECTFELTSAGFTALTADIARILDLIGPESTRSFFLRRISDRMEVDACSAPQSIGNMVRRLAVDAPPTRGAAVLPLDAQIVYNSAYPRDWNDGTLRSGVDWSIALTPGAEFRWDFLEAALAPVITTEMNGAYRLHDATIPGMSRFVHHMHGRFIDLPQRFGRSGDLRLDLGQSYIRARSRYVVGGISTENIAWGPARRNPLLLSGTAPGFPHLFVESAAPLGVGIGRAEFQLLWGRLSESDYFDQNPDNDTRALTGLFAVFTPAGLDGLHLGAGYLHQQTLLDDTDLGDLLWRPFTGLPRDSAGQRRDLRLWGLYARWANAPGGLEVYGEWARQDTWKQWVQQLTAEDASQAWTLGVQRVLRRGANAVRLSAEFSHLSDALPHASVGRGIHTYYVSPAVPQGHTHEGQLLGAPIGPGSESQFIGADFFWKHGRSSISVERVRYDADAYYAAWAQTHGPHGHDTEFSVRAGHAYVGRDFSIEAELGYSFRDSRSFLGLFFFNFPGYPYREDRNVGIRVTGRWMPSFQPLLW